MHSHTSALLLTLPLTFPHFLSQLHCFTQHYTTLHYTTLHYIASNYITVHYIHTTQLVHTQLTHTYSSTHDLIILNQHQSVTISFLFLAFPCRLYLSFADCWKKLTCGVIRSFNFASSALLVLSVCGDGKFWYHLQSCKSCDDVRGSARAIVSLAGLCWYSDARERSWVTCRQPLLETERCSSSSFCLTWMKVDVTIQGAWQSEARLANTMDRMQWQQACEFCGSI